MRPGTILLVPIATASLAWTFPAHAQTPSEVYAKAVEAIQANRCDQAVPLLKRYLQLKAQQFAAEPAKAKVIQDQIRECEAVQVAEKAPPQPKKTWDAVPQ